MTKAPQISAGLLLVRRRDGVLEFLLAHPGGPFFARRDEGAWTIPKGLVDPGEQLLAAAQREFAEETGLAPTASRYHTLGEVVLKSRKRVHAWAFEGDCDPASLVSNTFVLEWPPRSGALRNFPEIDRLAFFGEREARTKLVGEQHAFLDRARAALLECGA